MRRSTIGEITVVLIFMVSISAPLFGMVLKFDFFPQISENRELARRPSFPAKFNEFEKFKRDYTRFFNDHFGFRNTLVSLNFLFRHDLLRTSPSQNVIVGKNGWLFFTGDGAIEDYRGITHYDEEILRDLANSFEIKRQWLDKRGIRYLLVLLPNKETIYGEWLPDSIHKTRNKTGLDELIDYLKKHTRVEVVDVRKTLLGAKRQEQLFLKTDTHLNDYGAFLVYQEIMKPVTYWFPASKMNALNEFKIERKEKHDGDLAVMIGGTAFLKEEKIILLPYNQRKARKVEVNASFREPFAMGQEAPGLPRALVFRDSFLTAVVPFLSENFQYSKYYWKNWDADTPITEMIHSNRPDIVIEEHVERLIKRNVRDISKKGIS